MKRQQAQAAIDAAFADGLKRLFGVLVGDLVEGDERQAMKEFTAGVALHDDAYAKASTAIEQIFQV